MSNFDVFINGVRPDHIENTQEIIDLLSKKFKVSRKKIEIIVQTPNTRVKKSIPKEEADRLQKTLYQMGLICLYQPSLNKTGLLLNPMVEVVRKSCPSCHTKFPDTLSALPEVCDSCGIIIKKFLEKNDPDSDSYKKEQIRQQLSRKKSAHNSLERKKRREENEALRKKELEQAILNESPHLREKKKSKQHAFFAIGGCFLIGGALFYAYQENYLPWKGSPSSNDDMVQIEGLPTSIPMSDSQMTATTDNEFGVGSSQDAMQKTHGQAAQVLNAFGLDPDEFERVSGRQKISTLSAGDNTKQGTSRSDISSEKSSLLNASLWEVGMDDHEWDYYLAKKIKQAIIQGNFTIANQITFHLIDTEIFVTLLGGLSKATADSELKSRINENIHKKIKSSPAGLQAQYFSQAALYQDDKQASDALLGRAERAWSTVTPPYQQLLSALTMATSYFKLGNTSLSNQYFNKIKLLLPNVEGMENKIKAHIEIGQAFQQIGQHKAGLKWFKSTDKLIKKTSGSINDQSRYHIVRAFLDSGLMANAVSITGSISDPTTKILAYTLLASYFDNTEYLVSAENLLNRAIMPVGQKALVLSRIAQQYAKQSNMAKVETLFQQSTQFIKDIPESNKKDKLISLMANNYARPTKDSSAMILVKDIQSTKIKIDISKKLSKLSKVSELLSQ